MLRERVRLRKQAKLMKLVSAGEDLIDDDEDDDEQEADDVDNVTK